MKHKYVKQKINTKKCEINVENIGHTKLQKFSLSIIKLYIFSPFDAKSGTSFLRVCCTF